MSMSSAALLSLIATLQPADPAWVSFPIPNAHLASHLDTEEVMPPMNVPGRRYITSFDPATGLHIGTFLADNEEEIRRKIEKAGVVQKQWRNTNFTQRRRVIRSLLKWLVDNQELCARVACRDSGKTRELPQLFSDNAR
jgi:acyl-CoA reductase-like NAD-dependent aldehyde dehydrogenase